MKVVKPLKVPILTRVVEFRRKPTFHVAAMLGFPLAEPRALLDEMSFWGAVMPELGANVLDEGIAKACGELLVAGRFFAPGGKPVGVSFVRAQVGSIDKRLAVLGDRHWKLGVPTEPKPMTEMPVDWAHAFGGKDHPRNPYGLGVGLVERGGEQVHALPNIEKIGALVRAPDDRPEPDGFMPMDMTFEARRLKTGTIGLDYVEKYAPGLPPDHDPTIFNYARDDQWIRGAWAGDERILVENMSERSPRIESKLPGLATRAFVTHRTPDGERFAEIALRCDTVWLFPTAGIGAVVFHGTLPVFDHDAADIAHLVVACEEPAAPRSVDHYQRALERRLDKDLAAIADVSDKDLMPERQSGVAANIDLGPMGQWLRSEGFAAKNGHRGAERRRERARAEILELGGDPATYGLDAPIPEPDGPPPENDLDALVDYLVTAQERAKTEEARAKEAIEAELAARSAVAAEMGVEDTPDEEPPGGPPRFSAQAQFETYAASAELARNAGTPNAELEAKLADPGFREELERLEARALEGYRENAHLLPAAPPMTEEANEIARGIVQAAKDAGESLARRDFTGADLRGADLTGLDLSLAMLEGADLGGADLRGANLEGAVLARADLSGANLSGARLAAANLGGANLEGANLEGADLAKATLAKARVAGANFARARLVAADLLEVAWSGVELSGANFENGTFIKADLSGAKLGGASFERATFVECVFDRADLSGAKLVKSTFVSCRGENVSFARAAMEGAVMAHQDAFPGADFSDAQIERSCLRTTAFPKARFDRARLVMSDLSECDASGASFDLARLDQALLVRTNLERASLRGANLTEAIVTKAKLGGADFTGTQLTRADFTRARGDKATRFAEAVVRFTRFDKEAAS